VKLNSVCYNPATSTNPNGGFNLPCEQGLNCVLFPAGVGVCLRGCDAVTPGASCPTGSECCYGFDATGACLNSSSGNAGGGCITVQQTGQQCTLPSESVCGTNGVCFYASQPSNAVCYDQCATDGTGTCPTTGETCAVFNMGTSSSTGAASLLGLCCDSQYYSGDPNTCHPKAGICKRQTDVTCTQNSDCQSGLCQTYNGASFCTTPCVLNSDCPSAAADVNGDGVPDGGANCTTGGSQKLCVPNTGAAKAPACATAGVANNNGGGCGCTGTNPSGFLWLVALLFFRRFRSIR